MTPFDAQNLRLKQQLQLTADKDVAAMLGMAPSSWTGRKNRGSFPANELYALAAQRPDLRLDVQYVLTGKASETQEEFGARLMRINLSNALLKALPLPEQKKIELGVLMTGEFERDTALISECLNAQVQLTLPEQMLVNAYRGADAAGKKQLVAYAMDVSPSAPAGGIQQSNSGSGAVQVGKAGGKVSVNKGR